MRLFLTAWMNRPSLFAGCLGLALALPFAALGVLSLVDLLTWPAAPSAVTPARLAEALTTQDAYWAILQDPQWDCSTLLHTSGGDDTEVFIRDPENSIAILVTFTDPLDCADLDPAQAVGITRLMSEQYIQHLEEQGRLASFQKYRTLAYMCTVCGRENSLWLLGISAVFVAMCLVPVYQLLAWARDRAGRQESPVEEGSGRRAEPSSPPAPGLPEERRR